MIDDSGGAGADGYFMGEREGELLHLREFNFTSRPSYTRVPLHEYNLSNKPFIHYALSTVYRADGHFYQSAHLCIRVCIRLYICKYERASSRTNLMDRSRLIKL